jgi:hypothetical protein
VAVAPLYGICVRLEVRHVSSTLGRIVGAQIGADCGQLAVAGVRCRQMGALRRFRIEAKANSDNRDLWRVAADEGYS